MGTALQRSNDDSVTCLIRWSCIANTMVLLSRSGRSFVHYVASYPVDTLPRRPRAFLVIRTFLVIVIEFTIVIDLGGIIIVMITITIVLADDADDGSTHSAPDLGFFLHIPSARPRCQ